MEGRYLKYEYLPIWNGFQDTIYESKYICVKRSRTYSSSKHIALDDVYRDCVARSEKNSKGYIFSLQKTQQKRKNEKSSKIFIEL